MTEQDVVDSQAFKVINYMIDKKVGELNAWMLTFQDRVNITFNKDTNYGPYIRTRIHCEDPRNNGRNHPLPAHAHQFKDFDYMLAEIKRLETDIGDLQRLKCELTGDWDFCHGDLSAMKAVFGEVIEGMAEE